MQSSPPSFPLRSLLLCARPAVRSSLSPEPYRRPHRGGHLEALTRDRKGQHSIRINDQWRICFRWVDPDAVDVEIVDYH